LLGNENQSLKLKGSNDHGIFDQHSIVNENTIVNSKKTGNVQPMLGLVSRLELVGEGDRAVVVVTNFWWAKRCAKGQRQRRSKGAGGRGWQLID
jgi:hypothetical protein